MALQIESSSKLVFTYQKLLPIAINGHPHWEMCARVGRDLFFSHVFCKIHELINILGIFTK